MCMIVPSVLCTAITTTLSLLFHLPPYVVTILKATVLQETSIDMPPIPSAQCILRVLYFFPGLL